MNTKRLVKLAVAGQNDFAFEKTGGWEIECFWTNLVSGEMSSRSICAHKNNRIVNTIFRLLNVYQPTSTMKLVQRTNRKWTAKSQDRRTVMISMAFYQNAHHWATWKGSIVIEGSIKLTFRKDIPSWRFRLKHTRIACLGRRSTGSRLRHVDASVIASRLRRHRNHRRHQLVTVPSGDCNTERIVRSRSAVQAKINLTDCHELQDMFEQHPSESRDSIVWRTEKRSLNGIKSRVTGTFKGEIDPIFR